MSPHMPPNYQKILQTMLDPEDLKLDFQQ
jgi:hypothetical protein